jgi:pimeloyl-ACP methyl ester carboxylesterase
MQLNDRTIRTRHATIRLTESQSGGLPLLLIHGSGSSRHVFERQLQSPMAERFRLIALDLPGHGDSSNAADGGASYKLPGLAETVGEVVSELGISRMAVFGWSLGGHIALEMMDKDPAVAGVMLMGAPPIGRGPIALLRAFRTNLDTGLASKERFSDADVMRFARLCYGDKVEPAFLETIKRADGRLRKIMFGSMLSGHCADERQLVESRQIPIAIVNGSEDPFVRLGYIAALRYRALWDGMCHIIPDAGHAAFHEAPETFNPMLSRFADDVAMQKVMDVPTRAKSMPLAEMPQQVRRA